MFLHSFSQLFLTSFLQPTSQPDMSSSRHHLLLLIVVRFSIWPGSITRGPALSAVVHKQTAGNFDNR
ncbi:MAG: hypothetical protein D6775_07445 [Caldilineae bacterium]|nr:MAG: hypothetical protein D6775_07445 [Caldilineae bacterium]